MLKSILAGLLIGTLALVGLELVVAVALTALGPSSGRFARQTPYCDDVVNIEACDVPYGWEAP